MEEEFYKFSSNSINNDYEDVPNCFTYFPSYPMEILYFDRFHTTPHLYKPAPRMHSHFLKLMDLFFSVRRLFNKHVLFICPRLLYILQN